MDILNFENSGIIIQKLVYREISYTQPKFLELWYANPMFTNLGTVNMIFKICNFCNSGIDNPNF